eukprot:gnl/Hemi2/18307_TR6054_c0_g1_i1.p1 gnl/Hemi2/18307_TR6054_c0_g1~~gnl/Hemi2/18307_TR6054_c0_g1_i1.p1  ORF type:complete len:383 (+),score=70.19 gnl/Hemi2/18307_TR6054_c0_g1_i1:242-1390(+)
MLICLLRICTTSSLAASLRFLCTPEVIPVVEVGGIHVAELFHGPTLAFKDLPLQIVGRFLQYYLTRRNKRLTVVVGTSGDTGTAAAEAVRGAANIDYYCLFPLGGRCTRMQTLQLSRLGGGNVHMVGVDGGSDDLDVPIKAIFLDQAFREQTNLCSINSVNIARILGQVAHYFFTYLRVSGGEGTVAFSVPSGALGNLASGMIARAMGLPCTLLAATNANGAFARLVNDGLMVGGPTLLTTSPAMDIQLPYNIERILFVVCKLHGCDNQAATELVSGWVRQIDTEARLSLDPVWLQRLQGAVSSVSVSDAEAATAMKEVWTAHKYLLDPHTAVGYKAAADGVAFRPVCFVNGLSKQVRRSRSQRYRRAASTAPRPDCSCQQA